MEAALHPTARAHHRVIRVRGGYRIRGALVCFVLFDRYSLLGSVANAFVVGVCFAQLWASSFASLCGEQALLLARAESRRLHGTGQMSANPSPSLRRKAGAVVAPENPDKPDAEMHYTKQLELTRLASFVRSGIGMR